MQHAALLYTALAALAVVMSCSGNPTAPLRSTGIRQPGGPGSSLLARIQRSVKRLPGNWEDCDDSDALSDRSISPWDYRVDHDPERYPATLHAAVCRLEGCAVARVGRAADAGPRLRSLPVTQAVAVLRRGRGPRGETLLVPDTHTIAVACVCVRDDSC